MSANEIAAKGEHQPRSWVQTFGLWLGLVVAAAFVVGGRMGWRVDPDQPLLNPMAAVATLMAIWWMTEAVPLAVTALLPVVLFPLLQIPPYADVAFQYGKEVLFLFLGGFLIALGIEESGLHRRVALQVLSVVGDRPRQLVLGFMLATAALSMWISNTATTLMMLPIATSVLARLGQGAVDTTQLRRFSIALLLAVAYSASIGGIATLIGTPPNLVFLGFYEQLPDHRPITFAGWMAFALPFSVLMLVLTWLVLTYLVFPLQRERMLGGPAVIREQLASLGPISSSELRMAIIFSLTALLWITREPIAGWGWAPMLGVDRVTIPNDAIKLARDSTVAILMATVCFIVPRGGGDKRPLLSWEMTRRVPWGIILLFGGGFALGAGLKETGLDVYLGDQLAKQMEGLPRAGMIALVTSAMTMLTELTSNVASVSMLMPILGATSAKLNVPPWDLMVPATLAASCAFMLPVATPPNAIAYSTGHIRMRDMIRAGVALNIIGVVLVVLWMHVV